MTRLLTVRIFRDGLEGPIQAWVRIRRHQGVWRPIKPLCAPRGFKTFRHKATLLSLVHASGHETKICGLAPARAQDLPTFLQNVEVRVNEKLLIVMG